MQNLPNQTNPYSNLMVTAVFFRCLQQVALRALTSSCFLYSLSTSNSEQQGLCGSMSECPTIKDFRITFLQFTKQQFQRTLLSLRSCVARRLAVNDKPSYIRHTEGMSVMVFAMRSNLRFRSSSLDSTVSRNQIVILVPRQSSERW